MGVAWLKAFLRECTGCRVDAVAMHWYDSATNVVRDLGTCTDD